MLKVGATSALLGLFLSGCVHTGTGQSNRDGFHAASLSTAHAETQSHGVDSRLVTIERGDSLLRVIDRAGGSDEFYYDMSRHQQGQISQMYPGDVYEIALNATGDVSRVAKRLSSGKWLTAEKVGDDIILSEQDMVSQYSEHLVAGDLKYDLKGDLMRQGIPREVINESLEIMALRVDVRQTYEPGDTFTVIYRQSMLDGQKVGDPYVQSIKYRHQGQAYFAFRHKAINGHIGYYDERGEALSPSWLREPVKSYSRISSLFNPQRRHPISGRIRPHNGVDFAAPTGTPIYAASDGVVSFAGRKGGYGNYLAIDHMGRVETRYAHMLRLENGMYAGKRVSKGDVIGYVGSTGFSTGPHLHYEIRINGVAKDPLKEVPRIASSLRGRELSRFMASRDNVKPLMLKGAEYVAVHDARGGRG